jgi:hypothetical protein
MKVNKNLCLTLWDALNTRLGPLQWDLVASERRERPIAGRGGRYITPLHTVAWGGLLRG